MATRDPTAHPAPKAIRETPGEKGSPGADGAPGARGDKGDPGPGLAADSASTTFGTGTLSPPAGLIFAEVPGLTKTVTIPAGSVAYLATDGGIALSGTTAASVDIVIAVDDFTPGIGPTKSRRLTVPAGEVVYWSISHIYPLAPGSHTFTVKARLLNGSPVQISAAAAPCCRDN